MMYPLVRELAEDGIPVTVTCRVLKIARQPYYRWLACSVTAADLEEAHRANALFDAHRDDPEFGYRFLVDEARDAGVAMAERTAWRICSDNGWWSAFGKKKARGKGGRVGPPVHDDLVASSRPARRTSCGWATSPSTGPVRASSTFAPSRTCSRTGSSATRSTPG
jgi:putative transposase